MSKLNPDQKKLVGDWLTTRLKEVLAWYEGCDNVDETRQNITRDVESVLREMTTKFQLVVPLPFYPSVSFDTENKIIVKFISRSTN